MIDIMIKEKLKGFTDLLLSSIKDERIREIIKVSSFITGGAVASIMMGEEPRDYDFYFKNQEALDMVLSYYSERWDSTEKDNRLKYDPIFISDNAITLEGGVQFILRDVGSPEEIHKVF